jgi:glutathione S-transferase
MTVKLYHCHETRSMRTLWLLNELGIPFDVETMPFDHKFLRSKDYLGINPLGRIPAIVDDGMTLYESGAIAEYLVEKYDTKNVLNRPIGHAERYEWLKWIHFAETVIIPCQNMVQQYVFVPKEQRSEITIYFEVRRLGKVFDALEAILADREYLLKSGFSAADCGVGFSVYFSSAFVTHDAHPRVKAYLERISARPAFKKSQPENPLAWLKPLLGPLRNPNTGKVIEAA